MLTQPVVLAAQPTPLVDRTHERALIRQRLTQGGTRLLTLTGPAGVGKTRLALSAAAEVEADFADGVVVVDLASVRDPRLVLSTVAHAVGRVDVRFESALERLITLLSAREQLLVLDNFEQVLPAASHLADLLAGCAQLRLLAATALASIAGRITGAKVTDKVADHASNPLTEREREVLRLVAQGLGNKAIAKQLIISASTVNYHLIQVFNKLGVDSRAQAVAVALQRGFLSAGGES